MHREQNPISAQTRVRPHFSLSFKDPVHPLFACQSPGDRKISPSCGSPGVCLVSFSQSSPPPLFPSFPFIPGTIVRASSSGPLHIPGQKQKPSLTPMTRPAAVLSGMWRPPGVGWGHACFQFIFWYASFKGSRGWAEGGLKEWGVQNHQISREEREGEGRTASSGVPRGHERILG